MVEALMTLLIVQKNFVANVIRLDIKLMSVSKNILMCVLNVIWQDIIKQDVLKYGVSIQINLIKIADSQIKWSHL